MFHEVSPQQEGFHNPTSVYDWKESYYFQFYDPTAKLASFFYISAYPNVPKQDYLLVNLTKGETDIYLNTLPTPGKLDLLDDGSLRFEMIEPHEHWKIHFDDGKRFAQLNFTKRFAPFVYDAKQAYQQGVLEQEHYEQACFAKGAIRLADGKEYDIDCLGHRDHSWGLRDYAAIDEWNWIAAQFSWCTISLIKLHIGTKRETAGFLSSLLGNQRLTDIRFETHLENDGITPQGFTVHFRDEQQKPWQLESTKLQSMVYPPRQSKPGQETNIYEIVSNFTLRDDPNLGYGIAEYLISQKITQKPGV
ncbi:MAG: hypothetical protein ACFE89_04600 [Candidatus Hodarchaeota archaeon]